MTTDKDTKDAQFILMNGLESGSKRISNIRADSADQARKDERIGGVLIKDCEVVEED